ncbi:chromosome partitioning protein [Micromonospora sp. U21]|uniref:chromosome partitioning protein n=1 Tax=Micromonospora sp. U21 TaxID=2824899 RepID=UPI001B395DD1|nr:chromosome partitioning protein [Micromonospora sp. U21]MBQ0904257.1 chromosome partitioning protein [Micromonospora sp. U21]
MDENADRAQVPGQQPVPERDIEPLWPPDPADRGTDAAAPPWASVSEQRSAPPSSAPPSTVLPPVAAPPTGRPAVPGQPGAAARTPPSPSDYPSLTGAVPAPGGWGVTGPSGTASGWAPGQPSWPPPTDSPAPDAPGPTVDDTRPTPSTTDAGPSAATPGTAPTATNVPGAAGTTAAADPTPWAPSPRPEAANPTPHAAGPTPETAGPASEAGTLPGAKAPMSGAGPTTGAESPASGVTPGQADDPGPVAVPAPPIAPGGVDLDLPFTLDRPAAAAAAADRSIPADRAADGTATADPATPGSAATRAGGVAVGEDGPTAGTARPATESPWAYPPQRPAGATGTAHDEAAAGTPPVPAPPVPQPPHPGGPAAPHVGPGQAYPGQTYSGQTYSGQTYSPAIPGQAGPAPAPPPPPDPTQFADPPHGSPAPQQGGSAAPPPGPFPPSPGWYPPPWQQSTTPGAPPAQPQPYQEAAGVTRVPATGYPDATWEPETTAAPTAEDFARRRQVRPADPVATMGVRAVVNKMGLLRLAPGRHEQELKRDIEMVRRNFGGLRQVTVVNPKGGAGKTVAILLLAMTFGQKRGGYVLAWDNNETQGTLGMRAQQDFHSRTVRDMLRDLGQFQGAHGRVGDLSQYVRSQGEGMFDVLASDESATGGEMLTAAAFAEIREVVSRFYKLIFVDTGNNVRAQNWQASMDATDQLVVTMSARNDSAETAARMLDHLEQSGRQRLVRQAVTVVSMPPSRKEIDLPAIQEHFAARTRAVLLAPYERLIDSGEPIRYGGLSSATRDAWLKIAAAVAEGL